MIVKFTRRGTGRGAGPVEYLLGKERDREGAELLRGDPDQTEALIDNSQYAKRYTSGVLSFQEPDLDAATKREIMDSFEAALLPGLDGDQYDCLWVEHRDKDRLELNFVVPNVELTSGKRLQPYYDRADRPRIDAWKGLVNAKYELHDPDDPANQRALTYPSDLPRERVQAQRQITDGLLSLAEQGEVTNRAEVVAALEGAGFDVTRQTKTSISVTDPEGGKPLRLRGKLYERDFTVGDGLRAEIEGASRRYREGREERVRELRERFDRGIERKREDNQRRYPRPEPELAADRAKELAGRDHPGLPEPAAGRRRHRRDELVHRGADQRDHEPQRDLGAAGPGGRGHAGELLRGPAAPVREDRRKRRDVPERLPDTGGVLDDRPGARTAERLRELTERLRDAASGVAGRLREFAEHVRGYAGRQRGAERPGATLEQAGQRLEREGVALDARGQEAVKQRRREFQRGRNGPGMEL